MIEQNEKAVPMEGLKIGGAQKQIGLFFKYALPKSIWGGKWRLKVSWSRNDFLVSSISQRNNAKIWWISALVVKSENWMPFFKELFNYLSFWLNHFLDSRADAFELVFGKLKTPICHSEINWPLAHPGSTSPEMR